jgi:hypothetical protein
MRPVIEIARRCVEKSQDTARPEQTKHRTGGSEKQNALQLGNHHSLPNVKGEPRGVRHKPSSSNEKAGSSGLALTEIEGQRRAGSDTQLGASSSAVAPQIGCRGLEGAGNPFVCSHQTVDHHEEKNRDPNNEAAIKNDEEHRRDSLTKDGPGSLAPVWFGSFFISSEAPAATEYSGCVARASHKRKEEPENEHAPNRLPVF